MAAIRNRKQKAHSFTGKQEAENNQEVGKIFFFLNSQSTLRDMLPPEGLNLIVLPKSLPPSGKQMSKYFKLQEIFSIKTPQSSSSNSPGKA